MTTCLDSVLANMKNLKCGMSDDSSPVYHRVNYSAPAVNDSAPAVRELLRFIVLRSNQVKPNKKIKHLSKILPKRARSNQRQEQKTQTRKKTQQSFNLLSVAFHRHSKQTLKYLSMKKIETQFQTL